MQNFKSLESQAPDSASVVNFMLVPSGCISTAFRLSKDQLAKCSNAQSQAGTIPELQSLASKNEDSDRKTTITPALLS